MKRFIRNILLRLHDFAISRSFTRRMIRAVRRKAPGGLRPHPTTIKKFRQLWKPLAGRVHSGWATHFASLNGIADARYVPVNVYYVHVEPLLNNKRYTAAYDDKNAYDLLFPEILRPRVLLRCMDGVFFDRDYRIVDKTGVAGTLQALGVTDPGDLILKPSIGGGMGRGVLKLSFEKGVINGPDGMPMTLERLRDLGGNNFLVEEFLEQHASLSRLNPSSLNTIRVFTYRSIADERIIPLHFLQKVGSPGCITDLNYRVGMQADGTYNGFCIGPGGRRYTEVNGIGLSSLEPFPFMKALSECAVKVAKRCIHSRVLGLDMAADKAGRIHFIEVNNSGIGIEKIQLNNGPLFGEYTQEVLDYCLKNKRTYNYFFER
jgi:hypothetical protein